MYVCMYIYVYIYTYIYTYIYIYIYRERERYVYIYIYTYMYIYIYIYMYVYKGCRALAEFRDFTNRRFGNPLRTWFLLDPEANMKLGEKQFQRKCMEMGFRGNVTAILHCSRL